MAESSESLQRKMESAIQLGSVVRTMKALAGSSIGQYERSVGALGDYYRTIELGLIAYLKRHTDDIFLETQIHATRKIIHAVVFGSDQGLVGQFNEQVSRFAMETLQTLQGEKEIWAVGERVYYQLIDAGLNCKKLFSVPGSIHAITPLIADILQQSNLNIENANLTSLYLFHNKPTVGALYEPVVHRLLPFDSRWEKDLLDKAWPSNKIPEVIGNSEQTLKYLIQEYLFVSLFRTCAESLASENASRLSAMQRAEKNIEELVSNLQQEFHLLRQNSIDEELFDVIAGFEALNE